MSITRPDVTSVLGKAALAGGLAVAAVAIMGMGANQTPESEIVWTKANEQELPTWKIPNIPESAEAYYAPDSYHIIAQTQDRGAVAASSARAAGGALTYTFTEDGKNITRINDTGQDACSYFFPDQKRLVWTSTKDNLDMPTGNWSDSKDYPQGAELYISDLDGSNIQRLTDNEWYEAEVSVSPDGKWVVFGRQINGEMDLWMMKSDGTEERQLTFTPLEQEGAPFFLPDNRTITTRAWPKAFEDDVSGGETPMTVYTIDVFTGARVQQTFDRKMNWAPYPTPDGKHYVFVRIVEGTRNWEVYLGYLDSDKPPLRLTYNDSFDGFPSVSPDGKKLLFTRSEGNRFMSDLYTYVMDISSLNVGP